MALCSGIHRQRRSAPASVSMTISPSADQTFLVGETDVGPPPDRGQRGFPSPATDNRRHDKVRTAAAASQRLRPGRRLDIACRGLSEVRCTGCRVRDDGQTRNCLRLRRRSPTLVLAVRACPGCSGPCRGETRSTVLKPMDPVAPNRHRLAARWRHGRVGLYGRLKMLLSTTIHPASAPAIAAATIRLSSLS